MLHLWVYGYTFCSLPITFTQLLYKIVWLIVIMLSCLRVNHQVQRWSQSQINNGLYY